MYLMIYFNNYYTVQFFTSLNLNLIFKINVVTKFVLYLKLNENKMFTTALDSCSIVY